MLPHKPPSKCTWAFIFFHTTLFLICSNSLTNVLNNIKERKHDKKVCITNCEDNAKVFNQKPHQCRFYTGSPRYKDLLEYHEIPTVDASEVGTSLRSNIKEFGLQFILLKDYREEINSGFRKEDDIIEIEDAIEDLWVLFLVFYFIQMLVTQNNTYSNTISEDGLFGKKVLCMITSINSRLTK